MPRNATYTQIDKRRAASLYVIHGSSLKVSAETGIPARTVRTWTSTEWFAGYVAEAQDAINGELDALYSDLISIAGEKARERLQSGDVRVGKDGKLIAVPVSARDCAIISAVFFDKRALLRGRPTVITEESAKDRIEQLAAQFSAVSERLTHSQKKIPLGNNGERGPSLDKQ